MQFAKPGANSRQMWWDTAARWTACRQGEHIPIAWNFLHGCQSPVTLILWAVSCAKMPIKRMQIPTSSWMRDHTFSWKSLESSTPSSQRCIESNQIKTTARQGKSSSWEKKTVYVFWYRRTFAIQSSRTRAMGFWATLTKFWMWKWPLKSHNMSQSNFKLKSRSRSSSANQDNFWTLIFYSNAAVRMQFLTILQYALGWLLAALLTA